MHHCRRCWKEFESEEKVKWHLAKECRNLTCLGCGKTFNKVGHLYRHMRLVRKRTKLNEFSSCCPDWFDEEEKAKYKLSKEVCTTCQREFVSATTFKEHVKKCKGWVCDQCGETFDKRWSLKTHISYGCRNELSCPLCFKSWTNISNFGAHIKHCEEREKNSCDDFDCRYCSTPFDRMSDLLRHWQTKGCEKRLLAARKEAKQIKKEPQSPRKRKTKRLKTDDTAPKIHCTLCKIPLKDKTRVRKHFLQCPFFKEKPVEHFVICNLCSRAVPKTMKVSHDEVCRVQFQVSDDKKAGCVFCGKSDLRLEPLQHLLHDCPEFKLHPCQCRACDQQFAFRSDRMTHFRLKHKYQRRKFKLASSSSSRKVGKVRKASRQSKPDENGKKFSLRINFKREIRKRRAAVKVKKEVVDVENGKQKRAADEVFKQVRQELVSALRHYFSSSLRTLRRGAHFLTRLRSDFLLAMRHARLRACRAWSLRVALKKAGHLVCFSCERRFSNQRVYEIHRLRHAGMAPYSCPQCRAAFSTCAAVRQHMQDRHRLRAGVRKRMRCRKCGELLPGELQAKLQHFCSCRAKQRCPVWFLTGIVGPSRLPSPPKKVLPAPPSIGDLMGHTAAFEEEENLSEISDLSIPFFSAEVMNALPDLEVEAKAALDWTCQRCDLTILSEEHLRTHMCITLLETETSNSQSIHTLPCLENQSESQDVECSEEKNVASPALVNFDVDLDNDMTISLENHGSPIFDYRSCSNSPIKTARWVCKDCSFPFNTRSLYREHRQRMHSTKRVLQKRKLSNVKEEDVADATPLIISVEDGPSMIIPLESMKDEDGEVCYLATKRKRVTKIQNSPELLFDLKKEPEEHAPFVKKEALETVPVTDLDECSYSPQRALLDLKPRDSALLDDMGFVNMNRFLTSETSLGADSVSCESSHQSHRCTRSGESNTVISSSNSAFNLETQNYKDLEITLENFVSLEDDEATCFSIPLVSSREITKVQTESDCPVRPFLSMPIDSSEPSQNQTSSPDEESCHEVPTSLRFKERDLQVALEKDRPILEIKENLESVMRNRQPKQTSIHIEASQENPEPVPRNRQPKQASIRLEASQEETPEPVPRNRQPNRLVASQEETPEPAPRNRQPKQTSNRHIASQEETPERFARNQQPKQTSNRLVARLVATQEETHEPVAKNQQPKQTPNRLVGSHKETSEPVPRNRQPKQASIRLEASQKETPESAPRNRRPKQASIRLEASQEETPEPVPRNRQPNRFVASQEETPEPAPRNRQPKQTSNRLVASQEETPERFARNQQPKQTPNRLIGSHEETSEPVARNQQPKQTPNRLVGSHEETSEPVSKYQQPRQTSIRLEASQEETPKPAPRNQQLKQTSNRLVGSHEETLEPVARNRPSKQVPNRLEVSQTKNPETEVKICLQRQTMNSLYESEKENSECVAKDLRPKQIASNYKSSQKENLKPVSSSGKSLKSSILDAERLLGVPTYKLSKTSDGVSRNPSISEHLNEPSCRLKRMLTECSDPCSERQKLKDKSADLNKHFVTTLTPPKTKQLLPDPDTDHKSLRGHAAVEADCEDVTTEIDHKALPAWADDSWDNSSPTEPRTDQQCTAKPTNDKTRKKKDGAWTCIICDQSFVTRFRLVEHRRETKHGSLRTFRRSLNSWLCHLCPLRFPVRDELREHVKTCHSNVPTDPMADPPTSAQELHEQHRVVCGFCEETMTDLSKLRLHLQTDCTKSPYRNLDIRCLACGQQFAAVYKLALHARSGRCGPEAARLFVCPKCSQRFSRLDKLASHMQECDRSYSCGGCSRQLRNTKSLAAHRRHCLRITCQHCGRLFRDLGELQQHVQAEHAEKEPIFRCVLGCFAMFDSFRELLHHQRAKAGCVLSRHICGRCSLGFASLESFHAHHEACWRGRLVCPRCAFHFEALESLEAHLAVCLRACASCGEELQGLQAAEISKHVHSCYGASAAEPCLTFLPRLPPLRSRCPYCPREVFSSESARMRHLAREHESDGSARLRPYLTSSRQASCRHCRFQLPDRAALRSHVAEVHTCGSTLDNARPYTAREPKRTSPVSSSGLDYWSEEDVVCEYDITEGSSSVDTEDDVERSSDEAEDHSMMVSSSLTR